MKTRSFLIVVFAILSSSFIFSQNYFPLAIGNKWQFTVTEWDPGIPSSRTDTTTVEIIKDTLAPNNVSYFVMNGSFPLGEILRSDSTGVYYYDDSDSTDCLVYDYNAELNHPYTTGFHAGYDSAIVTLEYLDSSIVLSGKVKILLFNYNWLIVHNITLGENIGPVHLSTGGDGTTLKIDYNLIGYQVNGDSAGTLTSVKNKDIRLEDYKLYQNYPNPFNPSTTIAFSIPRGQNVELSIYDLTGEKIITLLNDYKPAGKHSAVFNSSKFSSGVYFYQLKTDEFIQTKKFIILK